MSFVMVIGLRGDFCFHHGIDVALVICVSVLYIALY